MSVQVNWMSRASDKVRKDLQAQFSQELGTLFATAKAVTVHECFAGYVEKQNEKVVLGVDVQSRQSYHTHIVKLGIRAAVANDFEGWRKCSLRHRIASRIFLPVTATKLASGRMAVIYEDGFQLFGTDERSQNPEELETVATWAIMDDKPELT